MVQNKRMKIRDKIVWKGKKELGKKIRNGTYVDYFVDKGGVVDENSLLADKEFFNKLVEEVKIKKESNYVYSKENKEYWLREWLKKKGRIL